MPDGGGGPAGLVLALAGRLVPAHRRAAWRREWEGELHAARRAGRPTLRLALGALADARATRGLRGPAPDGGGRGLDGGSAGMGPGGALRELRRAARSLARAPGFTLAAVVTLGAGLAGTAAIFTLVDAILLRPLPYPEAERLLVVDHTMREGGSNLLTRHTLLHVAEGSRTLEAVGGYRAPVAFTLTGEGPAERVEGATATAGLLGILGARAAVGRVFGEADDRPGAPPVVVLGHGLWERRFGGDPSVVGRTITVEGAPREVVGVMVEDVQLPTRRVDLWVPEAIDASARPTDEFRMRALARLAPGQDLAAARADLDRLTASLPEVASFFSIYLDQFGLRTRARPLRTEVVGDVERPLWILLGAVGIVLLVAVANVANLFLVRGEGRGLEVAVRSALGAPRSHLLAHFMAESFLVAAAAAVLALAAAGAGVRALVSLAPPSIPRLDALGVGGATVLVVLGLCVAVGVAVGAYPYLRFARSGSKGLAQRGTRGPGGGPRGAAVGDGLVAAQVALAFVLLAGAALLLRSFQNLRAVEPGFRAEAVLAARVALPAERSDDEVTAFLDRLTERLRGIPGVRAAAVGPSPMELGGCSGLYAEGLELPEGTFPPCAGMTRVGSGYFELLRVGVVAGRILTPAEVREGAAVAVVSEGLARRLWPGEEAVGRGLRPAPRTGPPWYRVVGVVADVRGDGPAAPPSETVYFPPVMSLDPWGSLRTAPVLLEVDEGMEAAAAAALRATVAEMDPDVPVTVDGSVEEQLARSMVRTSFTLFLLGAAAAVALILGVVGLYGVVSYRVGTRRAEFGIRMALGADGGRVRAMVLRRSLGLVLAGIVAGVVAAALGTRLLESLLFGVRPGDPRVMIGAAAALLVTAAAAAWAPAQRATRVDPATSLRSE